MKSDPALDWLINQASDLGTSLWVCDEHFYGEAERLPRSDAHYYVTNRYDIAQQFAHAGLTHAFNDFEFSEIAPQSIDTLIYRLSKEKPVIQHVLYQAVTLLKPDGALLISGLKNEGAKNFLDKAAHILGCTKNTRKHGLAYCAELIKSGTSSTSGLTNDHYGDLVPHPKLDRYSTKPGQFGWQKIDAGSELLIATLREQESMHTIDSLVDLGCGYGYLALEATRQLFEDTPARIVLTDNNAAALRCAKHNAQNLPQCEVVAADVGDAVQGKFDAVLCNPPFHQGFQLSGDLTDRFLASARRLLDAKGCAYFVVNAFIPIESKAKTLFSKVDVLANNRHFKVVKLQP